MKKLAIDDIITMHEILARETGGSEGLKDEGLLDSALQAPFQTFAGEDLHVGVVGKAAKLGHGIINNHPFVDGNKRVGILVMLTYLELNGYEMNITDKMLVDLTIDLANGSLSVEDLEEFIINN